MADFSSMDTESKQDVDLANLTDLTNYPKPAYSIDDIEVDDLKTVPIHIANVTNLSGFDRGAALSVTSDVNAHPPWSSEAREYKGYKSTVEAGVVGSYKQNMFNIKWALRSLTDENASLKARNLMLEDKLNKLSEQLNRLADSIDSHRCSHGRIF